jgi:hypothetical protein
VRDAPASVLGVISNASVPLGISAPGQPNISSMLWRTMADHKHRTYFFDAATSPNAFWAPLADLDLAEGAPVKKLPLAGGETYSGNAAGGLRRRGPVRVLRGAGGLTPALRRGAAAQPTMTMPR